MDFITVTWSFIFEAYPASLLIYYLVHLSNRKKNIKANIFISSVIVAFLVGISRMLGVFLFGGEGFVHPTSATSKIFFFILPFIYSTLTYMYWSSKKINTNERNISHTKNDDDVKKLIKSIKKTKQRQ